MKKLDNLIKEKEKNAKLEIERIKKENAEIIRKSKENSRMEIDNIIKNWKLNANKELMIILIKLMRF